jgi:crotonobetaine/carnitine-CoA ligase
MAAACVPALVADATVALARRFSARAFWDDVRRFGATQFNLLSSMTNILWGQPESPVDRDHKVRQCTMVPVPDFARDFERRFNIRITSSYSLTDFGQGTFLQADHPPEKFRSAGRPPAGVDIAILDDSDVTVPTGQPGEICLRNNDPASGSRSYYKMPEATAQANRNGWFHTGDRGSRDEDGYFTFIDRLKDCIRRRGENISSYEVERIVAMHPSVAECAAVGVPSELGEEEVMIVVVPRGDGVDPAELVEFCAERMAAFMVPRYVRTVVELPKTPTQKVQKYALREEGAAAAWERGA